MNTATISALQTIGVDPAKAQQGVTFGHTGTYYTVSELFSDVRGIKIFRLFADGKLTLRGGEQVKAIFS